MIEAAKESSRVWDIVVVGGGATGLGIAVDASLRGYSVLLFEQHDFAKATSSRSTKMAHGGVRYLQQGNIPLVTEALKERGLMLRNAPHLAHRMAFVVPGYEWWEVPFYGIGLKLYDILAGELGLGSSRVLSRDATRELIPTVETGRLRGGILFYDGQFDDARLAVNLMQTAVEQGGVLINYARVTSLSKANGKVNGVRAVDLESGSELDVRGRVVINATGPFSDAIRQMDDPAARRMMQPSQGVHLVLPREFLPGGAALMVPRTTDGRVLFAVPWHDRIIVGTTDTAIEQPSIEPRPLEGEVELILDNLGRYLARRPEREDILSVYAGIRPLVASRGAKNTAKVSRDEAIVVSDSGLVTIAGGKWTTYRKMGEKTVDCAASVGRLPERSSVTADTHIHGYHEHSRDFGDLWFYGSDAPAILALVRESSANAELIHAELTVKAAQVVFAVRSEMARTVEDFLARRTRILLLDAHRSIDAVPKVAEIMAKELGRDRLWQEDQVRRYTELASGYLALEKSPTLR
ncbi:MAG TPA: glycerol-3-phosphate dehydrogenase/oxidase [Spirochaetia bacterium]|nr:glycerol-3-phosphate dehydrogenase/oxidase [Spirochaetia bacterium]